RREDLAEILLDLRRLGVARPTEALRDTRDERVDDDALTRVTDHTEQDVRRLPPDAGQLPEVLHPLRDVAAVLLDDLACEADDRLRLLPEEAERRDVGLDLERLRLRER